MKTLLTFSEFELNERAQTDEIHIFDIDDTLLFSKSKVRAKEPGEKWQEFDTAEWAHAKSKFSKNAEFDFSDFDKYDNIYVSIVNGTPNIKVLKILDEKIANGHKIGILTARGSQDAIFDGLSNFLLYRDKKTGELEALPKNQFNKKYVFAVNDPKTKKALNLKAGVEGPQEAKAKILQDIFKTKYGFKKIYLYDDDQDNINAVKGLNDPQIIPIKV